MKSYFITFEGPEKSGKSTQAKLLKQYLSHKGFSCLFIREPGSTILGEKVRKILLDKKNTHISYAAEMLLYMAARAQIVKDVIAPALKKGKIVICDRFLDSTIVYQGYGLGMDVDTIKKIGEFVTCGIEPDITVLLDLGARESLFKQNHKKDRIELRSKKYHDKVRKGYLSLAKKNPRRIKIVEVKENALSTQRNIRNIIDRCLLKK
jgi:dTMP kinase